MLGLRKYEWSQANVRESVLGHRLPGEALELRRKHRGEVSWLLCEAHRRMVVVSAFKVILLGIFTLVKLSGSIQAHVIHILSLHLGVTHHVLVSYRSLRNQNHLAWNFVIFKLDVILIEDSQWELIS